MAKKILLIEDNKEISRNIKEYLELEGFEVFQVFDWEDWINESKNKKYDLILLDLMLPEIDWYTIARKTTAKVDTPIIMITAKDSISSKLEWFENWAVDYIVKPFDLRELEARIKAVLKINNTSKIIKIGYLYIDLEKREFLKEDKKLKITTKEFLIFEYLYENKNRVCTRTDLIECVWGNDSLFDDDAKLDVYISNLRKKLDKKLIETIKWVWYRFWDIN
jgi:DNA-binding response OmpR family regulator